MYVLYHGGQSGTSLPGRATLPKLRHMTRRLTEFERSFLAEYFADSLDLEPIRVAASLGKRSWSPYGPRISLVRHHFQDHRAANEIALGDPRTASVFAHEALHVWQRQGGRRVTWEAIPLQANYILGRRDPYEYVSSEDPAVVLAQFTAGNVEQQGKIFEDYVRCERSGRDTRAFDAVAQFVRARVR